ncbi:MAG: MAPEG family protein, partial [Albidovulum sp.]
MEHFAQYGHAIVSLCLFALIALALSPLSGAGKAKAGLASGAMPDADYDKSVYRLFRAHMNAVETLPVFATVTFAAMAAGANPYWVNILASAFLVSRILMLFVHIKGVGAPDRGPRSLTYVFGWATLVALA